MSFPKIGSFFQHLFVQEFRFVPSLLPAEQFGHHEPRLFFVKAGSQKGIQLLRSLVIALALHPRPSITDVLQHCRVGVPISGAYGNSFRAIERLQDGVVGSGVLELRPVRVIRMECQAIRADFPYQVFGQDSARHERKKFRLPERLGNRLRGQTTQRRASAQNQNNRRSRI